MPWITKEGRNVQEAQDAAVAEAGVPEAELDIEIVNEGAKGLFGLGGEPAVVRVRLKTEATDVREAFRDDLGTRRTAVSEPVDARARDEAPVVGDVAARVDEFGDEPAEADRRPDPAQQEEAAQLGAEIVRGIIERMGLEGEIKTRVTDGTVYVEVFGEELGILIGRSGATLEALQELVRAGIQRRLKTRQAVVVDVEAYWERRRKPEGGGRAEGSQPRRREGGGQRRGGRRGGRGRGRRGDGGGRGDGPTRSDGNVRDPEPRPEDEPDGNR